MLTPLVLLNPGTAVDLASFGAVGDGITDDSPAVAAALQSIMASGKTLYVLKPPASFNLANWNTISQTGPIRICAQDGAIFDGGSGLVSGKNFLEIQANGHEVDIEGLRFDRWARVFRYMDTFTGTVPSFRLFKAAFIDCFRGVVTWLDSTGTFKRLSITHSVFEDGDIALSFEGARFHDGLLLHNFCQNLAREAFRFGTNTPSFSDAGDWARILYGFNTFNNIGSPTTGECHAIRDYCSDGVCIGNVVNGVRGASDCEAIYFKSRWMDFIGNTIISYNGDGADRALLAIGKGEPRFSNPHNQTRGFAKLCIGNTFRFQPNADGTISSGPALFYEGGDNVIGFNWFENCGGPGGYAIQQGTSPVGSWKLTNSIVHNTFVNCAIGGTIVHVRNNGGTHVIDDNLLEYHDPAQRHNCFVQIQGQEIETDVYIRNNVGWAALIVDVAIKSDNAPHVISCWIERNSLKGGALLAQFNSAPPKLVHIFDNDRHGSGSLVDMNVSPKQFWMKGNRGLRKTTASTAAVTLERIVLPTNAVGEARLKVVARGATSADRFLSEIRQGIANPGGLFGTLQSYEALGGAFTTGRLSFVANGSNVDLKLQPSSASPQTWEATQLEVFYDAP